MNIGVGTKSSLNEIVCFTNTPSYFTNGKSMNFELRNIHQRLDLIEFKSNKENEGSLNSSSRASKKVHRRYSTEEVQILLRHLIAYPPDDVRAVSKYLEGIKVVQHLTECGHPGRSVNGICDMYVRDFVYIFLQTVYFAK